MSTDTGSLFFYHVVLFANRRGVMNHAPTRLHPKGVNGREGTEGSKSTQGSQGPLEPNRTKRGARTNILNELKRGK